MVQLDDKVSLQPLLQMTPSHKARQGFTALEEVKFQCPTDETQLQFLPLVLLYRISSPETWLEGTELQCAKCSKIPTTKERAFLIQFIAFHTYTKFIVNYYLYVRYSSYLWDAKINNANNVTAKFEY